MKKKKKNIYKVAIGIVILEIFMKLIAFLKQSFVAHYYGATQATDIYFVANDFMVSVSETIISAAKVAIMGIYASVIIKEGKKQSDKLISRYILISLPVAIMIVGIIIISAPLLSKVLAPSFNQSQSVELQKYIVFLSGIIIFTITIMIFETILNVNEKFAVSRIRSLIYSVCVIIACLVASKQGIKSLIIAQYLSFIIYLMIQYFASKPYYHFTLCNPLKNVYLKQTLKLMVPIMIGNSITRINYLVDKAVASGITTGAISSLAYCQILDQFVVVIVINSVCSIMFAHFSKLVANNETIKINETLNNTIGCLFLILIPITVIVFLQSKNIVLFVYGHGNFSQEMVEVTSIVLQGYSIRYIFTGVRDIIIQALYSYKQTKNPMKNSIITTMINIVVSVLFVKKIGILSIALGTSISAIIGMFLNCISFKKINKNYSFLKVFKLFVKSIIASLFSVSFSFVIMLYMHLNNFLELIFVSLIVFTVYFIGLYILKTEELTNMITILKKRTNNIKKKGMY